MAQNVSPLVSTHCVPGPVLEALSALAGRGYVMCCPVHSKCSADILFYDRMTECLNASSKGGQVSSELSPPRRCPPTFVHLRPDSQQSEAEPRRLPARRRGWRSFKQAAERWTPKPRTSSGQLLVLAWSDTGVPQTLANPGADAL